MEETTTDMFFTPVENLPRSSRKVKLPSWRQDYGTLMVDFSPTASEDSERSSIPKFTLDGKFRQKEKDFQGRMSYSCLQCNRTFYGNFLRRHWESHEKETGAFPCSKYVVLDYL